MPHPKTATEIKLGVALLRVSTDKQFQEGQSIEQQRRKVEFAATRRRTDIVRFFTEHYSGRKSDRRVLEEMLEYLAVNRDIEAVFIGDIDRLTRGGSEVYLQLRRRLRELQVGLVDTTGIIQPERNRLEHLGVEYEWAVQSPSHIAEIFMAEKAKTEASDILTRTIGQQIQLTREGYQVRPANFGYRNVKVTIADGTRKTILEPDPDEAKFVRRIYELRAEGDVPDPQIVQHINAMGYRSRGRRVFDPATRRVIGHTGHQLLTVKGLQKLIKKPIYCGIRNDAWNMNEPVEAPMEPIVTVDMFNRANRGQVVVTKRANGKIKIETNPLTYKNYRENREFLLRHVVTCPKCQKPMLASKSRNKMGKYFGYYHCSRGHKYFGVNKAEFESTVANSLEKLKAKPGFLPLFREVARDVWVQKNASKRQEQDAIQTHTAALRRKQDALVDRVLKVQSKVVQSKLESQIEELEQAIENAKDSLSQGALKEDQIEAYFQIAKNLLEHPGTHVLSAATKPKLEKIWGFIFTECPDYDVLRNGTPSLTLLYRFNRDFAGDKDQLVGQLALHWNTFEDEARSILQGLGAQSYSS